VIAPPCSSAPPPHAPPCRRRWPQAMGSMELHQY
jgi:hypothetical protein